MAGLTINQKKFCDEYLKSGNATRSYQKAGYKVNDNVASANATRLLGNASVKEYIEKQQAKVQNKNILTIAEIQEDLTQIAKMETERTKDRLKAYELLTRMQGGFLDKSEIKASITDYESKLKEVQDKSEF